MDDKHLWEIKHDYYCSDSNYYHAGELEEFKSWDEFLEHYGTVDLDMNLLFRWDWRTRDEKGTGVLELFYILQRKGIFRPIEILVSPDNEGDIKKWLTIKFNHLFKLWEPIA